MKNIYGFQILFFEITYKKRGEPKEPTKWFGAFMQMVSSNAGFKPYSLSVWVQVCRTQFKNGFEHTIGPGPYVFKSYVCKHFIVWFCQFCAYMYVHVHRLGL